MSNGTTPVLGATGKTGRRITAPLRLRGTPMRTASRSSTTRFDWSDPGGWEAVLRDVTTAYVVAPTVPGPVHGFVAGAEDAARGSAPTPLSGGRCGGRPRSAGRGRR